MTSPLDRSHAYGANAPVFVEGADGSGGSLGAARRTGPEVDPGEEPDRREDPDRRTASDRSGGAPELASGIDRDPRLKLRHLGREAARTLRVSRVGIWAFREAGSRVRLVTRYNQGDGSVEEGREYRGDAASSLWSLLGRVRVLAVNDTESSTETFGPVREWVARERVRAVLALPVRVGARLMGFVTFEEGRSPRSWTGADRDLASSMAIQAADLLERLTATEPVEAAPDEPGSPPEPEDPPRAGKNPDHGPASRQEDDSGEGRHSRVRRLPRLQGAAIIGGEEILRLLEALQVQEGYLGLLEEVLAERAEDLQLVAGAGEVTERLRSGMRRVLSALRAGVPERSLTDLNQAIPATIPLLAREAGPDLRLRIAPTATTLRVEVSMPLLERVLVHLVRNAREASEPDRDVRISWGLHSRGGSGGEESSWARIRVSDHGTGIPAGALPWLFEPLFSSRGEEGHPLRGLGLPFVQAVVEAHGGWVELRSGRGEGTEVDLFLPIASEPGAGTHAPLDAEAGASVGDASRSPRILLMEDEPLLARLLVQMLTRHGFTVDLVETPADAEARGRELRDSVDLLMVERELAGGVSGVELAEVWRSVRPGFPVVILDRGVAIDSRKDEPETGDGLPMLRRPFDPGDVLGIVRAALGSARPENRTGDSIPGDIPGQDLTH